MKRCERLNLNGRMKGDEMQRECLLEMVKQNQFTSHFSLDKVTDENAALRLNDKTASIGFIYRHIGETMNLFGHFLGIATNVKNTTIGEVDNGQHYDTALSRQLIDQGYRMLQGVVESSDDNSWLETVDTPFFGTVSRVRLLAHVLFHNSHHCGQISMTLSRGNR
jgi:uncharacterized damage-inducible protein DinB